MIGIKSMFDITVIGGGVVGLSMALAAAKVNFKVAVVVDTKLNKQPLKDTPGLRVYAINHASIELFKAINAWEAIQGDRRCFYHDMHVWDKLSRGDIHFTANEVGQTYLGAIIEEQIIKNSLIEQTLGHPQITIYDQAPLLSLSFHTDHTIVETTNLQFASHLVIGADGANSKVRQLVSPNIKIAPYYHHALVCTVKTEKSHSCAARQIFGETGPLAFLPLYDDKLCSIVWSLPEEKINDLKNVNIDEFNQKITEAFESHLGEVQLQSSRVSFPLVMRHAQQYVKENCVLVGDAAHTIHPLAGQGVNLGLADVSELIHILSGASEPFSKTNLKRYESKQRHQNQMAIYAMDGFKHLFNQDSLVPLPLKRLGLKISNQFKPLKKRFIYQAMGIN